MVFNHCMKFRRALIAETRLLEGQNGKPEFTVFNHLGDITRETCMCAKQENKAYHEKNCLYRECSQCGIANFKIYSQEEDQSDRAPLVRWEKFEYIICGKDANGKDKGQLQIVSKETSPGEMFRYFTTLLESFPAHQFGHLGNTSSLKS